MVKLPLRLNPREAHILERRRRARAQLKNTALCDIRGRASAMRHDPAYTRAAQLQRGAARNDAFAQLRVQYGLRGFDVIKHVQDHWRASLWMPLVIDSRIGDAIAHETLCQVEAWLYGRTGKPRPQPVENCNTIWGWGNDHGLRWDAKRQVVLFPQPGKNAPAPTREVYTLSNRGRKDLKLTLSHRHGPGSRHWQQRIGERRIVRVGLTRERGRRGWMWFALFTVEGAPYRNPERTRVIAAGAGGHVGVDLNVSSLAAVGETGSSLMALTSPTELAAVQIQAKRTRRRQRALDRSRRATNPGAYDARGRRRRGSQLRKSSKRARRLDQQQAATARRTRLNAERDSVRIAQRLLVRHGTELAYEKVSTKGWQRRWGKRMGVTRPATTMKRLRAEALRHGGSAMELPLRLALSQSCVCPARVVKDLSVRKHRCESCGLGVEGPRLDRDLFSALLARLVGQLGIEDFCAARREGTLPAELARRSGANELTVAALCAVPSSRVPSPSPRLTAGKRETVGRRSTRRLSGTSEQGVRALDGLPLGKVAHSGSKAPHQTDETTPSTGPHGPGSERTVSASGEDTDVRGPFTGPRKRAETAIAHSVDYTRQMSDSGP